MDTVFRLDNGLKVILRPLAVPNVSVWVGYRVGSRNEVPGMTGSTHWVEHMLFKGGGKLAKGDIDRLVSGLGGKFNAMTDFDVTMYFETLPAEHLETALFIESERMRNAAFDPKEVEAERTVVISEREGAEDQPEFLVEEELWASAFHVHPYHWTPIGFKQDLQNLGRDALYRHYLNWYAPNNATLVLVGGLDVEAATTLVHRYFDSLKPEPTPTSPPLTEPPQSGPRKSVVERPGGVDLLSIGQKVPPFVHDDTAALAVLAGILGGWRGLFAYMAGGVRVRDHRLHRALVDAKLATDVGIRMNPNADPSLLVATATVRPGVSPAKAEAMMSREFERIASRTPGAAEVGRVIRQVRAWHAYNRDGVTYQGFAATFFDAIATHDAGERFLEAVARVTPGDVRRVADAYLGESSRTVIEFHATGGTT